MERKCGGSGTRRLDLAVGDSETLFSRFSLLAEALFLLAADGGLGAGDGGRCAAGLLALVEVSFTCGLLAMVYCAAGIGMGLPS